MLGHICYSGIMGYYLGLSKFTTSKKRKKRYIRTGLLIVIYRHLNKKVRLSLLLSPFRPGRKVMPIMDEPPLPIAFDQQDTYEVPPDNPA
jgi:hypothetical protein